MNNKLIQGDIWLVNFNSNKKSKPGKIRPALIIQNQYLLDAGHSTTIVVHLTTNLIDEAEPLRIKIHLNEKLKYDSDLLIDQVRAVDNSRFVEGPLTSIDANTLDQVISSLSQLIEIA